jgi:hydrogenase maturation protein HypF
MLKNTFCLFTRTNAIVSQHIGDLKTLESYQDFMHNIALYQRLYMMLTNFIFNVHPQHHLLTNFIGQLTKGDVCEHQI